MSQSIGEVHCHILIGGVRDGEQIVVQPDKQEYKVARMVNGHRAPDHIYRLRTFALRPATVKMGGQGTAWPKISAFVHEDLTEQAGAKRLWEAIVMATGMESR